MIPAHVAASAEEIRAVLAGRSRTSDQSAAADALRTEEADELCDEAGIPPAPGTRPGLTIAAAHQACLTAHRLLTSAPTPGRAQRDVLAQALRRWVEYEVIYTHPCRDDDGRMVMKNSDELAALPPLQDIAAAREGLTRAAHLAADALADQALRSARSTEPPAWPYTGPPPHGDWGRVREWASEVHRREIALDRQLVGARDDIINALPGV